MFKKVNRFCGNCNAWGLDKELVSNSKFKNIIKHSGFEALCIDCFPEFKIKYEEHLKKEKELNRKPKNKPRYASILEFPDEKECTTCKATKPIDSFYFVKRKSKIFGEYCVPESFCIDCRKKINKDWQDNLTPTELENYKNYIKEYNKKWKKIPKNRKKIKARLSKYLMKRYHNDPEFRRKWQERNKQWYDKNKRKKE